MTSENVLFGQSVHSALPICALNVPATQARQGPPSGPVYPLLHTHATLDPPDCEFAGQLEHAAIDVAPVTIEKVLAEQLVHTAAPITGLYVPGPHTRSDSGKYKNTARSTFVDTVRKTLSIANGLPSELRVLSTTACRGNPVTDAVGVKLGV
jgi:hypothetical protein